MYALGTMLAGMPRTTPPIRRDKTSAGGRGICETAVYTKRYVIKRKSRASASNLQMICVHSLRPLYISVLMSSFHNTFVFR